MLKGVNKKVVEVIDPDNEFFERAILFIKNEEQQKDERLLRQKAADYLRGIRYRPRTPFQPGNFALMLFKLGLAAALGALLAGLMLR